MEDSVESVLVHIEPELAEDGTVQRRCRISVQTHFGPLEAEECGPDAYSAVQEALGKLSRRLARSVALRAA
jgi:ribosome-associated translation inhibitor RaiA